MKKLLTLFLLLTLATASSAILPACQTTRNPAPTSLPTETDRLPVDDSQTIVETQPMETDISTAEPTQDLRTAAPTPFEIGTGVIAFYSDRDGNPEIYTINADGSGLTRLTDDPGFDDSPAISPDGTQIAFLTSRHDPAPQFPNLKYEIYLMDIDGNNLRRLTDTEAAEGHPAWSPDGQKISFDADYDGDGFAEIYTMNSDGSGVSRLTENAANDQFADWSPDGKRIAFSSDRSGDWDIYVMDADGSNQGALTSSPDWQVFPAWSPDGSLIAFTGLVPRSRDTEVYLMQVDGSQIRQLTDAPGFDENPIWSPDGSLIAFQSNRNGQFEIFVIPVPRGMAASGNQPYPLAIPLVHISGDALWPSWSAAIGEHPQ